MFTVTTLVSFLLVNGMTTYYEIEGKQTFDTYQDCANESVITQKDVVLFLKSNAIARPPAAIAPATIEIRCTFMRRVG